ncbi:hypothetical protein F9817_19170 [Vibrio sp. CAIM 722]|uniref:Lipoprotein n=1 Tax=Vibrio eleionomae TaxID=2653505 RepID=A0A7X4LNS1_9VIBR|nr:hypothetical protein [Vibrio eleionomae]MZI95299.1 hypothetical protein [Vibrio eleionomae]
MSSWVTRWAKLISVMVLACLLAACGDKDVKVKPSYYVYEAVKTNALTYKSGDLYQLSNNNYRTILAIQNMVKLAVSPFASPNTLAATQFTDISDDTLQKAALEQKAKWLERYQSIDSDWLAYQSQHIESLSAQLEIEEQALTQARHQISLYQQKVYPARQHLIDVQDAISRAKQQLEELKKNYTEESNHDILTYSLSIHEFRHPLEFDFYTRKDLVQFRSCKKVRQGGLEGLLFNHNCYYLKPADKALLGKPSYRQGQALLIKYLTIKTQLGTLQQPQQGTLYGAKAQAEQTLLTTRLDAQKTIGKLSNLQMNYHMVEQGYDAVSEQLEFVKTAQAKQEFVKHTLQGYQAEVQKALVNASYHAIGNTAEQWHHVSGVPLQGNLTFNPDMKHSILMMHFSEKGENKTLLMPFSAPELAKQSEPQLTVSVSDEKHLWFHGALNVNNQEFQSLLLKSSE